MYYEPDKGGHGLPHNPLKSCVVPRPIGWITTLKPDGRVNLAPFSQFNLVGFEPGYVMFSANVHPPENRRKDTIVNAERTFEFVYNMATWDLREAVLRSSRFVGAEFDEIEAAGLTPAACRSVKVPRVAQSPVAFECRYHTTLTLPGNTPDTTHHMVVGRVLGVHIDDDAIGADGKLDIPRLRPLARLGYADYATVDSVFQLEAPGGATNRKMFGGD